MQSVSEGIYTQRDTQMGIHNELLLNSVESWQNQAGLIGVNELRMKSVKLILHHLHPRELNEKVSNSREIWLKEERCSNQISCCHPCSLFLLPVIPSFMDLKKSHPVLQLFRILWFQCSTLAHAQSYTYKEHCCQVSIYFLCTQHELRSGETRESGRRELIFEKQETSKLRHKVSKCTEMCPSVSRYTVELFLSVT